MTPELFRMQYVPVVLGADQMGLRLARSLFSRFGASSHLLDGALSPLHRLTPWLICHSLPKNCSSDIVLMALRDVAGDIEQGDKTPLLFVSDRYRAFGAPPYADELEAYYLIVQAPNGVLEQELF